MEWFRNITNAKKKKINMKERLYIRTILLLIILQSCNIDKFEPDAIISKYDKNDFSCLKNVYINFRGKAKHDEIILIVRRYEPYCPPYVVTINSKTTEIIKIESHLLKKGKINNYFSEKEIKNYIECFSKYDFTILGVDKNDNVYINPSSQQEEPLLLRKSINSVPKNLRLFKKYKGNWYVRR